MKSYRQLMAVALGLFLALSVAGGSYAAVNCPSCKAEIPASTKPVVAALKADAKCSMCSGEMKAGSDASTMVCPACKAEMTVCDKCAKTMAAEPAAK